MLSRFAGARGIVFTLNDSESFWSDQASLQGGSPRAWVHGVWSVAGLPAHLYIQKLYLTRWVAPRYSTRFPFVQFRQRVRAIEPVSGRRRRPDGAIEADFFLPNAPARDRLLTSTILF